MYVLTDVGSGVTAVREWAINKSNNVIASAICPGLSAMHKDIWYQERPDTNSNEQTGWKTQSLGKALDFPSAIEMYVHIHVRKTVRLTIK